MRVRAKFQVNSIEHLPKTKWDQDKHVSVPDGVTRIVKASAVMGNANKAWATASPSGQLSLTIDNELAGEQFRPGMFLYLDFTEAPEVDDPA